MTNIKRSGALLLLTAVTLVAGCGASKPQPPKSLCGIKTPASAISPLLPEEGERVTEKRVKSEAAPNACSVYVDGDYYFKIQHDPTRPGHILTPGVFTRKQPRTFQGQLGIDSRQAEATADCAGGKPPVFADITLNVAEDEAYSDERAALEKFLNAYMPNVQKHYGCKA
ncbi:hypothetical protein [Streptomyces abyssalis]|uniref:hypothetical protein n=1 Tax=Streptomyces abyssalis TaxID=933944 RepID=UPI001112EC6F|nr:hypothetical protein [Streptomyces abyssalis]